MRQALMPVCCQCMDSAQLSLVYDRKRVACAATATRARSFFFVPAVYFPDS